MWNKRGLTLTEILIVLIILGIIAGIGVPSFRGAIENSRMNEARVNLGIVHMGQRVFRANSPTNSFWNGGAVNIQNPVNAINTALQTEITGNFYPSITVTALPVNNANTYQASTQRAAGAAVNWTFTIDQTGTITCGGGGCPCNPCT